MTALSTALTSTTGARTGISPGVFVVHAASDKPSPNDGPLDTNNKVRESSDGVPVSRHLKLTLTH